MNATSTTAAERIVALQADDLARIRGAARLRVLRGRLWLTLDGQLDDHMLLAGDSFALDRGARALLQALDAPASLAVAEAAPSWPLRAARAVQAALRQHVTGASATRPRTRAEPELSA